MLSFNVEQARRDIHNVVIVVMNQLDLSVQEAMAHVNEWHSKRASDFMTAMVDLPPCPSVEIRAQLKSYVNGLANWVTANYEWSFETRRFFGEDSAAIKEHGIVKLLPKSVEAGVTASGRET